MKEEDFQIFTDNPEIRQSLELNFHDLRHPDLSFEKELSFQVLGKTDTGSALSFPRGCEILCKDDRGGIAASYYSFLHQENLSPTQCREKAMANFFCENSAQFMPEAGYYLLNYNVDAIAYLGNDWEAVAAYLVTKTLAISGSEVFA